LPFSFALNFFPFLQHPTLSKNKSFKHILRTHIALMGGKSHTLNTYFSNTKMKTNKKTQPDEPAPTRRGSAVVRRAPKGRRYRAAEHGVVPFHERPLVRVHDRKRRSTRRRSCRRRHTRTRPRRRGGRRSTRGRTHRRPRTRRSSPREGHAEHQEAHVAHAVAQPRQHELHQHHVCHPTRRADGAKARARLYPDSPNVVAARDALYSSSSCTSMRSQNANTNSSQDARNMLRR